jgi:hypothetical protein
MDSRRNTRNAQTKRRAAEQKLFRPLMLVCDNTNKRTSHINKKKKRKTKNNSRTNAIVKNSQVEMPVQLPLATPNRGRKAGKSAQWNRSSHQKRKRASAMDHEPQSSNA